MTKAKPNPSFLNGVPELLVLRLLSQREMYGYEIVKAIHAATNEALSFGEGCIYPLLHSLEKDGYLSSARKEVNGRNRFYYKLTSSGKQRLRKIIAEWGTVNQGVSIVLGGRHVQPSAI